MSGYNYNGRGRSIQEQNQSMSWDEEPWEQVVDRRAAQQAPPRGLPAQVSANVETEFGYRGPISTEERYDKMDFRNHQEEQDWLYGKKAEPPANNTDRREDRYGTTDNLLEFGSHNTFNNQKREQVQVQYRPRAGGYNNGRWNNHNDRGAGGSGRQRFMYDDRALDPNGAAADERQRLKHQQRTKESNELIFSDSNSPNKVLTFIGSNATGSARPSIQSLPRIAKKSDTPSDQEKPKKLDLIKRQAMSEMTLEHLQKLYERTLAQNNELKRSKFKRGVQDHDPELIENHKLLNDVKVRLDNERKIKAELDDLLEKIRKKEDGEAASTKASSDSTAGPSQPARPTAANICSTDFVESQPPREEEDDKSRFIYTDPGNHWCEKCGTFFINLSDYLKHLHTEDHWKNVDTKFEPWRSQKRARPPIENASVASMKGAQFLVPARGFYCLLCNSFLGSTDHADDHCKSSVHNRSYVKFSLSNQQYEHIYQTDKGRAMEKAQRDEARRIREEQEKEQRERDEARQKKIEEERRQQREAKRRLEENVTTIQCVRDKLDQNFYERKNNRTGITKFSERNNSFSSSKSNYSNERERLLKRSISSTPDPKTLSSSPPAKKRDPKLDRETEVQIPRDEIRRAYRVFMQLSRETGETNVLHGLEAIGDTMKELSAMIEVEKEDRNPTEEDLKRKRARNFINSTTLVEFDDDSGNNFTLSNVLVPAAVKCDVELGSGGQDGNSRFTLPRRLLEAAVSFKEARFLSDHHLPFP